MSDTSNNSPRVSVVVPVHNRAEQLSALLDSLGRMTLPPEDFVVVVCDDGSSEDILGVIEQAREESGLNVVWHRQERRGPGSARNLGLRTARGEFIAFTDSDCTVERRWLDQLLAPFDDPETGIVGGAVQPHPASPAVAQCSNWIMCTPWAGGARDPRSFVSMSYCPRAGNMAVRASLARESGGFPERRYAEDVEFTDRLKSTGAKAVFAPEAIVYHNEQRGLRQVFSESVKKGLARARLWRTRRAMEWIHAVPALFVLYLLILLLTPIVSPRAALFAGLPAIAYFLVNLLVAVQAALSLRSAKVLFVAPWCALVMHVGYGVGFWLGLPRRRRPVEQVEGERLTHASRASQEGSVERGTKYADLDTRDGAIGRVQQDSSSSSSSGDCLGSL